MKRPDIDAINDVMQIHLEDEKPLMATADRIKIAPLNVFLMAVKHVPKLLEYIQHLESNPVRAIPHSRSDEEAAVGLWYSMLDRARTKDDFIELAADWAQSIRANAVKVQLGEGLRDALEAWIRHPESMTGDTTDAIQLRCKVAVAYRATKDGGAT